MTNENQKQIRAEIGDQVISLNYGAVPLIDLVVVFTQVALLQKSIEPTTLQVTHTIMETCDVLLEAAPRVMMPTHEFETLQGSRITLARVGELCTYTAFLTLEIIKCLPTSWL